MIRRFLSSFVAPPSSFGNAGIRKQYRCGALTIIGSGLTGLQRGIEIAETGVAVLSFIVRYFSYVKEDHQNNLGEVDGMVKSTLASREVTIEAEVTGATGVMAYTFLVAAVPANDIADFGSPTGGLYMSEATVTQSRADWRKVSIRLESHPLLA